MANRVSATGFGESKPVTTVSDCANVKGAKLVACLQPDRRVDVDVPATKSVEAVK
jgi:OOP family OmpA-OmpF porin